MNILELNRKILRFGLFLIVLSLIFTVGFVIIYRLDNPVFLKMYVEEYVSSNKNYNMVDRIELKYITNLSDDRKVKDIYFEEEPNIEVLVSHQPFGGGGFSFLNNSNNNQREDIYGRYVLRTLYLKIDLNNIDRENYEIELNNAHIEFNDRSRIDVDLGRIIIYRDERRSNNITSISSSSSSDGTSSFHGNVEKDIELLDIRSPLLEDLKDYLDISIGDIDYREISGIKCKQNQTLSIYTKFKTPENILGRYTFYDIKPKLYYQDKNGEKAYERIYNIDYTPYDFDLKGIFNYLRARGVI